MPSAVCGVTAGSEGKSASASQSDVPLEALDLGGDVTKPVGDGDLTDWRAATSCKASWRSSLICSEVGADVSERNVLSVAASTSTWSISRSRRLQLLVCC